MTEKISIPLFQRDVPITLVRCRACHDKGGTTKARDFSPMPNSSWQWRCVHLMEATEGKAFIAQITLPLLSCGVCREATIVQATAMDDEMRVLICMHVHDVLHLPMGEAAQVLSK